MGTNLRKKGAFYEKLAAEYLLSQGFIIVDKNYHTRTGEIDLIARETVSMAGKPASYLVFIEVKFRSSQGSGWAAEAVTYKKQLRIMKAAQIYMKQHGIPFTHPVRFDVLAIDGRNLSLTRNAFGGM